MTDTRLDTAPHAAHPVDSTDDRDALLERLADLPDGCRERQRVKERVVAQKLPLAARLARRYLGCGEPYEELRQVAALGLVKAINGYDPRRGTTFSAYAVPTILGELRRHFRDHGWSLRVPRALKDARREMALAASDLAQQLGRTPDFDEIVAHAGLTRDQGRQAVVADAAYDTSSLNAAASPGGAERQELLGEPDGRMEQAPDRVAVTALLNELPERERQILTLRFFDDLTQSQIGDKIGVSQMHVSRLLRTALGHLRQALLTDGSGAGAATCSSGTLNVRRFTDDRLVVSVHGRLDRDSAEELRRVAGETAREATPRRMVLDLAQTRAVDRSGAAVLCYVRRMCESTGGQLVLLNIRRDMRPALRDAGLEFGDRARPRPASRR